MKTSPFRLCAGILIYTAIASSVGDACAQNPIQYISSTTGLVLFRSGNTAVVSPWQGQKPIEGFTGDGQIKMDGFCLTGNIDNKALTWEICRSNDPGQRWVFDRGRLLNERGRCADIEGGRDGTNVPVLASSCSGAGNRLWKAHYPVPCGDILAEIPDPATRQSLSTRINAAAPGQRIPISLSEKKALEAAGASKLIHLDGASLICAGGMNLISTEGMKINSVGDRKRF